MWDLGCFAGSGLVGDGRGLVVSRLICWLRCLRGLRGVDLLAYLFFRIRLFLLPFLKKDSRDFTLKVDKVFVETPLLLVFPNSGSFTLTARGRT